jgi:hypothetical protein
LVTALSKGKTTAGTHANPAVAEAASTIKLTQEFESRLRAVESRLTDQVTTASKEVTDLKTLVQSKVEDLTKKVN